MSFKFKKVSSRDIRLLTAGIFCLAILMATTTPSGDSGCGKANVGKVVVVNDVVGIGWYFKMTGPEFREQFIGSAESATFTVKPGKYQYVAMNDHPGQGLLRPCFGEFSVVAGKKTGLLLR